MAATYLRQFAYRSLLGPDNKYQRVPYPQGRNGYGPPSDGFSKLFGITVRNGASALSFYGRWQMDDTSRVTIEVGVELRYIPMDAA